MKHILYLTMIFCVFGFSHLHAQTKTDALYQAAIALPDSIPIKTKIKAFKKVVKYNVKYAPAHNKLAWLYLKQGKPSTRQSARFAIDRALTLDPQNLSYQLTKGAVLWSQHHYEDAVEHYEALLQKHPHCLDAAFWLSYYHLHEFLENKDRAQTDRPGASRNANTAYFNMSSLSRDPTLSRMESVGRVTGFGVIKFTPFAKEHWDKTREYLGKCLEINPDFRDAYYMFALLNLERGRPDRMVTVILRLLEKFPNDKDGLLFCGLGYLAQGLPGRADEYFSKALTFMAPEERAILENVNLITRKQDRNRLARVSHDIADGWVDTPEHTRFWQSQDPLFLTPYNERRMEHYARLAYANLRFSQPSTHVEGWRTDMGQTYIKFGRYRYRRTTGSSEAWFYEGFSLSFLNTQKGGLGGRIFNWQAGYAPPMAQPYMRDPWALTDLGDGMRHVVEENRAMRRYIPDYIEPTVRDVFKRNEPRYVDPYKKQRYTLPNITAAFQQNDSIRLEVAYAIPKRRVKPLEDGSRGVINGVFLFDDNWTETYRDPKSLVWPPESSTNDTTALQNLREKFIPMTHTLRIKPGKYLLATEVLDPHSFAIGTFRANHTFDIIHDQLTMSDLLLATHIAPRVTFPKNRQDLNITPNPLRAFQKSESVFIYLELYNLKRNAFGQTEYQISYRISRPKDNEIDPTLFADIDLPSDGQIKIRQVDLSVTESNPSDNPGPTYQVTYEVPKRNLITEWIKEQTHGWFRKRTETTITAQYEGTAQNDFTYLQIDISQIPIGIHKLTVTAQDMINNDKAEKDILFRITP